MFDLEYSIVYFLSCIILYYVVYSSECYKLNIIKCKVLQCIQPNNDVKRKVKETKGKGGTREEKKRKENFKIEEKAILKFWLCQIRNERVASRLL